MRKVRQIDEGFEEVFKASGVTAQVAQLKEWAGMNQVVVPLVRWGVGAEKPDWGLPEGMPEANKVQDDIPDGMGETTITLEWRRIKQFTDPTANIKNLPPWKQEMNWLQILEGVHHKEAAILTAVKDGKLLDLYPKLEKLLSTLGIEEYNKPEPKKKRKSRKKKEPA